MAARLCEDGKLQAGTCARSTKKKPSGVITGGSFISGIAVPLPSSDQFFDFLHRIFIESISMMVSFQPVVRSN